jgi:hypothetical protein
MATPRVQVQIEADTKKFDAGFAKAAAMVRSVLTVGAIVGAARAAIELGSRISDLSNKAQVSAKWLQQIGYAAQMAGSSMDDVANAVLDMSRAQAEALAGSEGTVAAFKALGVTVADLRVMRGEQLFDRIAVSIEKGAGDSARMNAALQVLGRGGRQLIGGLAEGFSEARAEAERLGVVMSDEAVGAMDERGDRVDTLTLQVRVLSAEFLKNAGHMNTWVTYGRIMQRTMNLTSPLAWMRAWASGKDDGEGMMDGLKGGAKALVKHGNSNGLGNGGVLNIFDDILNDLYLSQREESEQIQGRIRTRRERAGSANSGMGRQSGKASSPNADALARIGIYVGGAGSVNASLLDTQRQALTVLRAINSKVGAANRRPGRFDQ